LNRNQLEAVRDRLSFLSGHHSNLARKLELERFTAPSSMADVTKERNSELLAELFSGLVSAAEAALAVTPCDESDMTEHTP
jgi:hypothetical protein